MLRTRVMGMSLLFLLIDARKTSFVFNLRRLLVVLSHPNCFGFLPCVFVRGVFLYTLRLVVYCVVLSQKITAGRHEGREHEQVH